MCIVEIIGISFQTTLQQFHDYFFFRDRVRVLLPDFVFFAVALRNQAREREPAAQFQASFGFLPTWPRSNQTECNAIFRATSKRSGREQACRRSIELRQRLCCGAAGLQLHLRLSLLDLRANGGRVHGTKLAHRGLLHRSVELRAVALTDRSIFASSSGMRQYECHWATLTKMKHAMTAGLDDGRRMQRVKELECWSAEGKRRRSARHPPSTSMRVRRLRRSVMN